MKPIVALRSRVAVALIAGAALVAFFSPNWLTRAVAQQGQVIMGPWTVQGHVRSAAKPGQAPPALTTCGTSPAIQAGSNDQAGRVVTGSGATTCTITFAQTWTSAPSCNVSAEVATQPTWTVSATAITFATSIASTAYHYRCIGIGSGS